ncbi:MAG: hypothetical protein LQ348_000322, partial [Seirophora lacunosa]
FLPRFYPPCLQSFRSMEKPTRHLVWAVAGLHRVPVVRHRTEQRKASGESRFNITRLHRYLCHYLLDIESGPEAGCRRKK